MHRALCWLLLTAAPAYGQSVMQGARPNLFSPDAAILESSEARTDLPCTINPRHPELGFDLGLHSGYEVVLPLRELAGNGGTLVAIFRVIPEGQADQAIYFNQRWKVPAIAKDASGTARLQGGFRLGEGKYTVDWLMRDQGERYCSGHWPIAGDLRGRDRQVTLRLEPGEIAAESAELFAGEAPVERNPDRSLDVSVLVHIASQAAEAPSMRGREANAVVAILRNIAREPYFGRYSVTAFNLERGEVLFRDENGPAVDFPALGKAIQKAQLGTIDVQALRKGNTSLQFLGELIAGEMERNHPDVLIFVGPKAAPEFPSRGTVRDLGTPASPIFYLNYDSNPEQNPWRDMIGSVVKVWNGIEYTISRPRDLFQAWSGVMSRIGRGTLPASAKPSPTGNSLVRKK